MHMHIMCTMSVCNHKHTHTQTHASFTAIYAQCLKDARSVAHTRIRTQALLSLSLSCSPFLCLCFSCLFPLFVCEWVLRACVCMGERVWAFACVWVCVSVRESIAKNALYMFVLKAKDTRVLLCNVCTHL